MESKLLELKKELSILLNTIKDLHKINKDFLNQEGITLNTLFNLKEFSENILFLENKVKHVINFINTIVKPSTFYSSSVIKRIIIKHFRNKMYVCDEISQGRVRFDVLGVERFNKVNKVVGFEIKTSKEDLQNDKKFEQYLSHSNILYFVVTPELLDATKEKVKESTFSKHIGIYVVDYNQSTIKMIKKAFSNKKNLNIEKIKNDIIESGYNRYIYF